MLIKVQTLDKMFEKNPDKSRMYFNGSCQKCGCHVRLEIHHLSMGYGLLGGVLFEPVANRLLAECEACYKNRPNSIINN